MTTNDKVFTLAEAAEHLRLTTRAVAKIAKANGLCMVHGRTILLTGSDINGIKERLRQVPIVETAYKPKMLSLSKAGGAFEQAYARVVAKNLEREADQRKRKKSAQ